MSLSGTGGLSGVSLISAGIHGQFKAELMRRTLDDAGVMNSDLRTGFDQIEQLGQSMTILGVEHIKHELIGSMLDELG